MKIIRSEDLNLWEKEKERGRKYYNDHIEKCRAYQKKWQKEHYNKKARSKAYRKNKAYYHEYYLKTRKKPTSL